MSWRLCNPQKVPPHKADYNKLTLPTLNSQVFDSLLSIVDDAIAVASEAVTTAEKSANTGALVTLTKVASETYDNTAKSLVSTGLFPGRSAADISKDLRYGGEGYHIALMEKLASNAIFPISNSDVADGELVEKSATSRLRANPTNKTAVWQQAFDEAESELY
jgi:hypothetical protein